jgi:hypothetical protein
MTHAERQARYRAKQAESAPTFRYRKSVVAAGLGDGETPSLNYRGLQDAFQVWLDALPENMAASATAEALHTICDLDLSVLESIVPSRRFGRH